MHLNLKRWPHRPKALAALTIGLIAAAFGLWHILHQQAGALYQIAFYGGAVTASEGWLTLTYNPRRNEYLRAAIRSRLKSKPDMGATD